VELHNLIAFPRSIDIEIPQYAAAVTPDFESYQIYKEMTENWEVEQWLTRELFTAGLGNVIEWIISGAAEPTEAIAEMAATIQVILERMAGFGD